MCLCEGEGCSFPSINSTSNGKTTKLGSLSRNSLTVSSVTGGPRISFVNGDSCSSSELYMAPGAPLSSAKVEQDLPYTHV